MPTFSDALALVRRFLWASTFSTSLESTQIITVQNLGDKAILIHGNALTLDMTCYEVIFFFNPFRGQMAKEFFSKIPNNILTVVTVNHDPIIEPILIQNFKENYSYQHPIYKNFNAKIWLRY
jgi:hypothetical protein